MYAFVAWLAVSGWAIVSGNPDSCNVRSLIEKGYRLKNVSYNFAVKSSIFSCAASCVATSICASFDFDERRNTCFLNFNDSSLASRAPDPGFLHSDISDWPKTISGLCSKTSCGLSEHCATYRNNSTACHPLAVIDVEHDIRTSYTFPHMHKQWADAQRYCQEKGGHLAIIKNVIQNNFIQDIIGALGHHLNHYLGGFYNNTGDWYEWVDGTEVLNISLWAPGEPDYHEGRCMLLRYGPQWKDRLCTEERLFICQFNSFT
ncbi:C-type lectin domain family 10 member A-like [Haliotis rufescens]|uniref:C-type lectin domain family 10 member A-like n=1 Tax=Haliotis rufescens TaxID=6454 RepID=UPI00201F1B17|nr:C-type lectin domain family 10 member A-like [Haliotis rufescens]